MEEIDSFPLAKRARCRTIGWEDLHHDVLVSIAELLSVPDSVRFGAACRTWATAAKAASISSYSHSPWLLFIPEEEQADNRPLYLLNRSDRKYHRIPVPSNTTVIGQTEGWIVLVSDYDCTPILLNPLTKAERRLPSFAKVLEDYEYLGVARVVLSAVPSSGSPYVALAVLAESNPGLEHIYFARSDDHEWTKLYVHVEAGEEEEDDMITNAIYHQGRFFVLFNSGKLFAYDFSSGTPTLSVLVDKEEEYDRTSKLLVSAPHGRELLQVRYWDTFDRLDQIEEIDVLKLDPEKKEWVEVVDLGSGTLFVDPGQAMLFFDTPERDCFYFPDHLYDSEMQTPCTYKTVPIWFVPSLS